MTSSGEILDAFIGVKDQLSEAEARIVELEGALWTEGDKASAQILKDGQYITELEDMLREGVEGFGYALVQTSDAARVQDWRRRARELLEKPNE